MKRKPITEETRLKMSVSQKGRKHSEETKKKIGLKHKNKIVSLETKLKLSKSKKGTKNLKRKFNRWSKYNIRYCFCGKKLCRGSISDDCIHCSLKKRVRRRGDKCHFWRGGITAISSQIRNSYKNRQWRSDVFTRDKFTCVKCGDNEGRNLEADHIIPLSIILKNFKIKSFNESIGCELLWDINNGRTLCISCHKKTDTYGSKPKNKYELLTR